MATNPSSRNSKEKNLQKLCWMSDPKWESIWKSFIWEGNLSFIYKTTYIWVNRSLLWTKRKKNVQIVNNKWRTFVYVFLDFFWKLREGIYIYKEAERRGGYPFQNNNKSNAQNTACPPLLLRPDCSSALKIKNWLNKRKWRRWQNVWPSFQFPFLLLCPMVDVSNEERSKKYKSLFLLRIVF